MVICCSGEAILHKNRSYGSTFGIRVKRDVVVLLARDINNAQKFRN